MKLPQHKGFIFASAVFSAHALIALAAFTGSRWAHGKKEFEEPIVAGSLVISSIILAIVAAATTLIGCLAPTKTRENQHLLYDPTPSFANFFHTKESGALNLPLASCVVEGVAATALLFYSMFSTHIVAASLCTAGIGMLGLFMGAMVYWRFEQLSWQEYTPLRDSFNYEL